MTYRSHCAGHRGRRRKKGVEPVKRIVEDHSLPLAESLRQALAQGRTRRKGPRYHVLFIVDRDHEPNDPLTFEGETAARGLTIRGESA